MAPYTVLLTPDLQSGGYTVSVPALPGCIADGENLEEALMRSSEAISVYPRGEDEASMAASNRAEVIVASVEVAGAA